jgi:hypothetical protein
MLKSRNIETKRNTSSGREAPRPAEGGAAAGVASFSIFRDFKLFELPANFSGFPRVSAAGGGSRGTCALDKAGQARLRRAKRRPGRVEGLPRQAREQA